MQIKSKKILFTFITAILISSSSLVASTYDYNYSVSDDVNTTKDYFMYGNFDEIIRFDKILLNGNSIDNNGTKTLDKVAIKVKDYIKNYNKVIIKIIGHSSSNLSDEDSLEISKNNALTVQKHLIDNGIDENITVVEFRGAKDQLYTDATNKGRILSNRAMLTLYINKQQDLDGDGVRIDKDKCPNTQKGVKVSDDGCKLKSIIVLLEGNKKGSSIIVKTEQGSVVIDKPNQFVSIKSNDEIPSAPKDISKDEIEKLFEDITENTNKKQLSYVLYFNNIDLTEESKLIVQNILNDIDTRENPYIKIIGHTDTVGTQKINLKVGLKRAQKISNIIKNSTSLYGKIDIESYSESNLAIQTDDGVFEQLNRRVEVFIY